MSEAVARAIYEAVTGNHTGKWFAEPASVRA